MQLPNITQEQFKTEQANYMTKVYGWMTGGLAITGLTAHWVASTPEVAQIILGNNFIFYSLLICQFILVGALSSFVSKLSVENATSIFIGYAILNGLTMSSIFLAYTGESIALTFLITAGTFASMSIYGYYTKRDLTSIGSFSYMALIGLILTTVINMFLQNEMFYWITSFVGVLIFVAMTASDIQKIKSMNRIGNEGTDDDKKEAIMGALTLYLDFINLFTHFLRFFGNKRDR